MAKKTKEGIEVVAKTSFSTVMNGEITTISKGQRIELPEGADWLKAGLVIATQKIQETADLPKGETASISGESAQSPMDVPTVQEPAENKE